MRSWPRLRPGPNVTGMSELLGDSVASDGVGGLLRTWRQRRRYSQLELSSRAEVSTRHLSRVETDLARPSPDMILHLCEHLDVPLRERNRLLLAGGYAPRYPDRGLDDSSLEVVMDGLRRLLDAHSPYPALLLDSVWDVVDANPAVAPLLQGCDPALLEPPINVIRLCIHPGGLTPRILNLAEWVGHLRSQVVHRRDRTFDPRLADLVREMDVHVPTSAGHQPSGGPVLALELATDTEPMRLFSSTAQLTTSSDATLEGLHLETFLPADASTRERLLSDINKQS